MTPCVGHRSVARMTDDLLHESILVNLLTDAWRAVLADPDVASNARLDALAQRIPDVEEGARALRMLVDDLFVSTSPSATRARAASADAATKAADARAKVETDRILRQVERTAAREALDVAKRELDVAKSEYGRASDVPVRERLLLKGAMLDAEAQVAAAEAMLAKVAP